MTAVADGAAEGGAGERVLRALADLGQPYEVIPCDPALADTTAFCAAYGFELAESANTIVVQGRSDPPCYAACVVLATTRLDVNHTVRRLLGVKKASFAPGELTVALTGMEVGGVTPLALPPGLALWIDRRVTERGRIILGGGSRNWKILAAPALLLGIPGARVVDGLAYLTASKHGAVNS